VAGTGLRRLQASNGFKMLQMKLRHRVEGFKLHTPVGVKLEADDEAMKPYAG
jgi:hypothetical protein